MTQYPEIKRDVSIIYRCTKKHKADIALCRKLLHEKQPYYYTSTADVLEEAIRVLLQSLQVKK